METIIWASVTMRCASFSPTRFFQLAGLAFVFDLFYRDSSYTERGSLEDFHINVYRLHFYV